MSYDALVIGGGHNGLTTAALLGQAGRRVAVLEARPVLGGLAARDEFAPGFTTPGLLQDTTNLRGAVVEQLDLVKHGMRFADAEPNVFAPQRDGRGLVLSRNDVHMQAELDPVSQADTAAWLDWRASLGRLRPFVQRVLNEPPPDTAPGSIRGKWELARTGLALRRLGRRDMTELLRVGPMCVADWVGEWFETPLLKSLLAGPAVRGGWVGPWSPGTAANLLLHECSSGRSVASGPAGLVDALAATARAAGCELRTDARVSKVLVSAGWARGVELEDGETLHADVVAASCDPRTLLGLMPRGALALHLEEQLGAWRMRGTTAKLDLAWRGELRFRCRPDEVFERAHVGETLDDLERAYDPVKYGELPQRPHLEIHVPSIRAPYLATEGHQVVSILVHWVPLDVLGGWTDERRAELERAVLATLGEYVDDVAEHVVASRLLTPRDIERTYGLTGGQVQHGEHALDQLLHMRPNPSCSRYATPLAGLYLCGAGSHPGGGISCGPGQLAARAILEV